MRRAFSYLLGVVGVGITLIASLVSREPKRVKPPPKEESHRVWHSAMAFLWLVGALSGFYFGSQFLRQREMEREPASFWADLQDCADYRGRQDCLEYLAPDIGTFIAGEQTVVTAQSALFILVALISLVGCVRRCIGAYLNLTPNQAKHADPWYGDRVALAGITSVMGIGAYAQWGAGGEIFDATSILIPLVLTLVCLEPVKDWFQRPRTLFEAAEFPKSDGE